MPKWLILFNTYGECFSLPALKRTMSVQALCALNPIINCHEEPIQVKPATPLIPIDDFLILSVEEFYGIRCQSGSFSSINVGSIFLLPA